jgi:hypothetical protein
MRNNPCIHKLAVYEVYFYDSAEHFPCASKIMCEYREYKHYTYAKYIPIFVGWNVNLKSWNINMIDLPHLEAIHRQPNFQNYQGIECLKGTYPRERISWLLECADQTF